MTTETKKPRVQKTYTDEQKAARHDANHAKRVARYESRVTQMKNTLPGLVEVSVERKSYPDKCECCGHPRMFEVHTLLSPTGQTLKVGCECAARLAVAKLEQPTA